MPTQWNVSATSSSTTFTLNTAGTYGNNYMYYIDKYGNKSPVYANNGSYPHLVDPEEEPDEPALWEVI